MSRADRDLCGFWLWLLMAPVWTSAEVKANAAEAIRRYRWRRQYRRQLEESRLR